MKDLLQLPVAAVVRFTKDKAVNTDVNMLAENYWLEGKLNKPIAVGETVSIFRHNRNGIKAFGIFETTQVVKIEGDKIHTQNSVWSVTQL